MRIKPHAESAKRLAALAIAAKVRANDGELVRESRRDAVPHVVRY
jgi:hypothetical protein